MPANPHDPKDPIRIAGMAADPRMSAAAREFFLRTCEHRYSYNFSWLGRPIIQYPQDLMAMQEIIWAVQPRLIVETGVAHGGSLIFYASMLELCGGDGRVLGIDIEIRPHNRQALEQHPLFKRIALIEGSSTDDAVARRVQEQCRPPVLVVLDSNHTHAHVLRELQLYAPLVTRGSYLVVFDTVVDDMPASAFPDRPWGPGNNPRTAVRAFLETTDRFVVDQEMADKLLITVAPGGYLKCVKD
jgi:cephalosporin hydroxylase